MGSQPQLKFLVCALFVIVLVSASVVAQEAVAMDASDKGIEHEDIGYAGDDSEAEYDSQGRLVATTDSQGTNGNAPPGSQIAPSQVKVIVPADANSSNTHDPGVTILEAGSVDEEQTGIEDDEFGVRANEDAGAVPVHMDLEGQTQGDELPEPDDEVVVGFVEGDSADDTNDGLVDDPDDEKSDGDIIIKGVKIKENYADKEHKEWIDILSAGVSDEEDLELYAAAIVATDETIEEIAITSEIVQMKFEQPAQLFGFIPVTYTATATVDEEIFSDEYGRVKVKFPWWLAFAKDNSKEVKKEFEGELSSIGEDAQLANIDLQDREQKVQRILQMMSNVAKASHDTAMAIIRKTG